MKELNLFRKSYFDFYRQILQMVFRRLRDVFFNVFRTHSTFGRRSSNQSRNSLFIERRLPPKRVVVVGGFWKILEDYLPVFPH